MVLGLCCADADQTASASMAIKANIINKIFTECLILSLLGLLFMQITLLVYS
jgi:hypothetical protein